MQHVSPNGWCCLVASYKLAPERGKLLKWDRQSAPGTHRFYHFGCLGEWCFLEALKRGTISLLDQRECWERGCSSHGPLRGFCSEPFFGRKSYFHCVCTILISISKESIFYVPSDRWWLKDLIFSYHLCNFVI